MGEVGKKLFVSSGLTQDKVGKHFRGPGEGYEGGVPGEGYKLRIEILEKVIEIDFIKFPINFKWNSKKSVDPDPLKKLFKFFMYKYHAGFYV